MKLLPIVGCCLLMALGAGASTAGSFRGKLVAPPPNSRGEWIFVQGNNGLVRRVQAASAKVLYADEIPVSRRVTGSATQLPPGTDVRVTAEQDSAGEWQATEVEVLDLPANAPSGRKRIASTIARPRWPSNDCSMLLRGQLFPRARV